MKQHGRYLFDNADEHFLFHSLFTEQHFHLCWNDNGEVERLTCRPERQTHSYGFVMQVLLTRQNVAVFSR